MTRMINKLIAFHIRRKEPWRNVISGSEVKFRKSLVPTICKNGLGERSVPKLRTYFKIKY